MTTVSFPGLGIPKFEINDTAFSLFGKLDVKWYGIIITCGIILAFIYCAYRSKQEGIKFDDLLDIAIYAIIFAVIGARGGYVLFSLSDYTKYLETDGFIEMVKQMINIRNGGLQIYGAIIVGALTILIVCKVKKISTRKMLDSVAPAMMIGQAIGRWGNFMNGEAHGAIVEEGHPLYFIRMGLSPYHMDGKLNYGYAEVHPTFLYESLWNIVGFIIINALYKKKKFDGQIVLMYLSWYGFGRMFIETLRTDSLMLFKTGIRVSSLIGLLCFLGGVGLLIFGFVKTAKSKKDDIEYVPTYAKISHYGENKEEDLSYGSTVEGAPVSEDATEDAPTNEASVEDAPTNEASAEENDDSQKEEKSDVEKRLESLLSDDESKKD